MGILYSVYRDTETTLTAASAVLEDFRPQWEKSERAVTAAREKGYASLAAREADFAEKTATGQRLESIVGQARENRKRAAAALADLWEPRWRARNVEANVRFGQGNILLKITDPDMEYHLRGRVEIQQWNLDEAGKRTTPIHGLQAQVEMPHQINPRDLAPKFSEAMLVWYAGSQLTVSEAHQVLFIHQLSLRVAEWLNDVVPQWYATDMDD